jgi:hypothetical protein
VAIFLEELTEEFNITQSIIDSEDDLKLHDATILQGSRFKILDDQS